MLTYWRCGDLGVLAWDSGAPESYVQCASRYAPNSPSSASCSRPPKLVTAAFTVQDVTRCGDIVHSHTTLLDAACVQEEAVAFEPSRQCVWGGHYVLRQGEEQLVMGGV